MARPRLFHRLALGVVGFAALAAALGYAWSGPTWAVAIGSAQLVVTLLWIKRRVVAAIPTSIGFCDTTPAEYPDLDVTGLDRLTGELEAIGFARVRDYRVLYEGTDAVPPPGFARLFLHEGHRCYAELNQASEAPGRPLPLGCLVSSLLEDGWVVSTTSREPSPATLAFLQHERSVWRSEPGAGPERLLADHLRFRSHAIAALGVAPSSADGVTYFRRQAEHHGRVAATARGRNVCGALLRGLRAERHAPSEWLGALPGSAA